MRITAGSLKNQNVITPKGLEIRPTASKIRQALFNILFSLDFIVEDVELLDLFSGSGIISFEFLSRGAKSSVLLDKSKRSIECSKKNARNLKIFEKLKFVNDDALKYVSSSNSIDDFDVFYLDPPYKFEKYMELLKLILNKKKGESLLIVESSSFSYLDDELRARLLKDKSWGDTFLAIYK